jgi:ferredoxin
MSRQRNGLEGVVPDSPLTCQETRAAISGERQFAATGFANLFANWAGAAEPNNQYKIMAHVVTSKCLGCKFTDCVEVCPVACFYELEGQLVIHPEDCIDCTACVAECPVEAIYAEADVPAEYQSNIEFNSTEAKRIKDSGQSAILQKKDPLPTAAARKTELGY